MGRNKCDFFVNIDLMCREGLNWTKFERQTVLNYSEFLGKDEIKLNVENGEYLINLSRLRRFFLLFYGRMNLNRTYYSCILELILSIHKDVSK